MQLSPTTVIDYWRSFPSGMNAGIEPQLLERDQWDNLTQLANLTNGTTRGSFITNRPPFKNLAIPYTGAFNGSGLFQGACRYAPDSGNEFIVAAIGGRLYSFAPATDTAIVTELTQDVVMDATIAHHWLWQTENYIIDNDGVSVPRIFDGTNTRLANVTTLIATSATGSIAVPDPGGVFTLPITAPYTGPTNVGCKLYQGTTALGNFEIIPAGSTDAGFAVQLVNNNDNGETQSIGAAVQIINDYTLISTGAAVLQKGGKNQIGLSADFVGAVGDSIIVECINLTVGGHIKLTLPIIAVSPDLMTITVAYNSQYPVQVLGKSSMKKANGSAPTVLGTLVGGFSGQAIGSTFVTTLSQAYTGPNQNVTINGYSYTISQVTTSGSGGNVLTLKNLTATATTISTGATVYSLPELPPGRMGAYIQGRNWMCLPDGISYIASDQVGDSSGTATLNYRDAVLQVTENSLLGQGGSFRVPGDSGKITFMVDLATLDASLGQGPVQVGTPKKVFSCAAPTIQDPTQWLSVTNPIQTESLIANGGLSQESAVVVNGDLFFRSTDGLRSLVLARREFVTWGNTIQSNEVRDILAADDQTLLSSAIATNFDNRVLMGTGPQTGLCGVYWQNVVAINFDPLSTLRGKAPSVWDGQWTGLNALAFVTGQFSGVERCFAFSYNEESGLIELLELLPSRVQNAPAGYNLDNGTDPITVTAELPVMLTETKGGKMPKLPNDLCRLSDGEIYVKDLESDVTFTIYFRPDYDQEWHFWASWVVPQNATYQPRMGFGQPPDDSDPTTGRPWCVGYAFQLKVVMEGHGVIMGGRVSGELLPTETFAPRMDQILIEAPIPEPPEVSYPVPVPPEISGELVEVSGEEVTVGGEPVEV